jgi:hypothetical protein
MALSFKYSVDFHFELYIGIVKIQRPWAENYAVLLIILLQSLIVSTQVKGRCAPVDIENLLLRRPVILAAVWVKRDLPILQLINKGVLLDLAVKYRNLSISKKLDDLTKSLTIPVDEDSAIVHRNFVSSAKHCR